VDAFIQSLSQNGKFRESEKYMLAYKSLQRRSIALIRTHVMDAFENTSQTILGHLNAMKASREEGISRALWELRVLCDD
jgi:hypothetical protein